MPGSSGMRGPEGLRVYDLAREVAEDVDEVLLTAQCRSSLADQLRRAAQSIYLNIAEGAGHYGAGKKIYHYQLAHASGAECIAGLTLLQHRNTTPAIPLIRRKANMVCVMLSALIKSQQQRNDG